MKQTVAFLLVLGLLGTGWVYGWRWVAGIVQSKAVEIEQKIADGGGKFECSGRRVEGFPFRVGIFCDTVSLIAAQGGAFSAGALRSAAQLYNPGRFVSEIDGPAAIELADGRRFRLEWKTLRNSGRVALSGVSRFSTELEEAKLQERVSDATQKGLGVAQRIELHARLAPDKSEAVDLAFLAVDVRHELDQFPGFTLSGDVQLDDFAGQMRPGSLRVEHFRRNGASGMVRSLVLQPVAGGKLRMEGPLSVGNDGVIDGDITLSAAGIQQLAAFFLAMIPSADAKSVETIATLLDSIVPQTNAEGKPERKIRLSIKRGKVSAGFLPLGQLAPLW